MSKDILITPKPTGNPRIDFSGDTSATIHLEVLEDGSIAFVGYNGTLFSIIDNSVGSLLSVNNISGLPIFEVFSYGSVDVNGDLNVTNDLYITGNTFLTNLTLNDLNILNNLRITGNTISENNIFAKLPSENSLDYAVIGEFTSAGVFAALAYNYSAGNLTALYSDGNSVVPSAMFMNGDVGIGKVPTVTLDVSGDIKASGYLTATTYISTANVISNAYEVSSMQFVNYTTGYVNIGDTDGNDITLRLYSNSQSSSLTLTDNTVTSTFTSNIISNGSLGINVTPSTPLHVKQNAGDTIGDGVRITMNTGGGYTSYWDIYSSTYPYEGLWFVPSAGYSYGGYISPSAYVANIDFTGQHRVVPTDISGFTNIDDYVGLIVDSDGTYTSTSGADFPTINEALPNISLTTTERSKKVFGVLSNREDIDDNGSTTYGFGVWNTLVPRDDPNGRLIINSVGEGSLWVCNKNGNIENGDYICSAGINGLGMKQDDDLLHNYTVSKITQDCLFNDPTKYIEFEYEGQTYRKQFVGCTYHCG